LDKLPVTSVRFAGRNVDQGLEPLENAFTGYLPFPGFEIKNKFVRMIGANIG
jgi:hypothetical protein